MKQNEIFEKVTQQIIDNLETAGKWSNFGWTVAACRMRNHRHRERSTSSGGSTRPIWTSSWNCIVRGAFKISNPIMS